MNSYIGWWGQRGRQRWHLVESEVTDRLVMRCGRQMRLETAAGELRFLLEARADKCRQCAEGGQR